MIDGHAPTPILTVGYIGMGGNARVAHALRPLIEDRLGMRLVVMSEWADADVRWEIDTWLEHAWRFDILIAPVDCEATPWKGNNKLTQYMALGKPVVASPLDSYLSIVAHGENAFIARTDADWALYLARLRDDAELRARIGRNALRTVAGTFSVEAVTTRILDTVQRIRSSVDIIVAGGDDRGQFDVTARSLIANTQGRFVLHIVAAGVAGSASAVTPDDLARNDLAFSWKRFDPTAPFAARVNWAIERSHNRYVAIVGDDLLFAPGWNAALMRHIENDPHAMVAPLCRGDERPSTESAGAIDGGARSEPGVQGAEPSAVPELDERAGRARDELIESETLPLRCVMFERRLVHRIGILDEHCPPGAEEADYCRRARAAGWRLYSVGGALASRARRTTREARAEGGPQQRPGAARPAR